ncbi:TPA: isoleucine--tRNA ligase [Candidatus Beckwithbacteria bacterium]|nr:isoleucine--tRNA ligase [Candidatus Beckwithbacteria bacterium]
MAKAKKPFQEVSSHPDFVKQEEELLKHWYQAGIVKKYLTKNKTAKKKFSFLDGPITANNPMGVHHARGRTYKDLWQRYFTMRGYRGRYQNGFDCQGLWVEVEVEKELGFKSKKDIEKYGVEKFVNQCKARVLKYSAIQTEQSKRLAMFADWDNSYFTMSDENNYAIWNFLKVCHERGWIYKGHDSVPWCPRCQTAISQHEMLTEDYKEVTHKSIYFTLPLVGRKNESLLVWTTTPWTLPANIAVAVDKTFSYSLVEVKSGRRLWLAKDLVKTVLGADVKKVLKTVKGEKLVGLKYQTAFDSLPAVKKVAEENPQNFHTVVATDPKILEVTLAEGTGLVHTAVSAGSEDFKLGQKLSLPMIPVIDDSAHYLGGFGPLSGKNAKNQPELIFDFLKTQSGSWVYQIHDCKHRYPSCWRCKTELVWKVSDEWLIAMDRPCPTHPEGLTLRKQLRQVTKKITWIPDFGLERELDWLKNMHDWLISKKNRYWGLALPIYECAHCGCFEVIGSKPELKKRAVSGWDKFSGHTPHKPWIDEVKISCSNCSQVVSRVEPVGNPWLDAGIVPFSTLPPGWFPADFITEAFPGQFKNWFYAMLVMATVLKKTNPYKTVLGYESVVGEDGRPMHKSWGNAIEFNQGAAKIGVDVMRWMYADVVPTQILPFGFKKADEIRRQFILILWNSYRFFVSQANADGWSPVHQQSTINNLQPTNVLDQWILNRLIETAQSVTGALDDHLSAPASSALKDFVADFSTWYIRRSRDRVGPGATDPKDKDQAYQTMYFCLLNLTRLLAPFMPYLADTIYTNLTGEPSVHLSSWPEALVKAKVNQKLLNEMSLARDLASLTHSQRKAADLALRVPLTSVTSIAPRRLSLGVDQIFKDEVNVASHLQKISKSGQIKISRLDRPTPAQIAQGTARKLVREIQAARRQAKIGLTEKVTLVLPDWPEEFSDYIIQKTLALNLKKGKKLKIIRS